jgi:hypothetical protein
MVSLSCISCVDGNVWLDGDIVAGLKEDNQQQVVCLPESHMYSVELCFGHPVSCHMYSELFDMNIVILKISVLLSEKIVI